MMMSVRISGFWNHHAIYSGMMPQLLNRLRMDSGFIPSSHKSFINCGNSSFVWALPKMRRAYLTRIFSHAVFTGPYSPTSKAAGSGLYARVGVTLWCCYPQQVSLEVKLCGRHVHQRSEPRVVLEEYWVGTCSQTNRRMSALQPFDDVMYLDLSALPVPHSLYRFLPVYTT